MDTLAARHQMVEQQVRTWEVLDPNVLDAMNAVPREAFVPQDYRDLAFADAPIPIGFGEFLLPPKLQGRILQALSVQPSDHALEVGTGTGYLAACFGLLAQVTRSLDIRAEFTATAAANLRQVPGARVQLETRDALNSAPLGQFDVIAVTGSLPVYNPVFEQALNLGGRLFVVVGDGPAMDAVLVRRVEATEWTRESLFETVIGPLVGAKATPKFEF